MGSDVGVVTCLRLCFCFALYHVCICTTRPELNPRRRPLGNGPNREDKERVAVWNPDCVLAEAKQSDSVLCTSGKISIRRQETRGEDGKLIRTYRKDGKRTREGDALQ